MTTAEIDNLHSLIRKLVDENKKLKRQNIGGVVSALRAEKYKNYYEYLKYKMIELKAKSITEIIYLVVNGLDSIPLCPDCKSSNKSFIDINQGYRQYCTKCNIKHSRDIQGNVQRKYNVSNSMFIDSVKQKVVKAMRTPGFQERKQAKAEATNISKYGVKSTLQVKEFRDKGRQTTFDKTGYHHHMHDPNMKRLFHDIAANTDRYKDNLANIVAQLAKYGYVLARPYYNATSSMYLTCTRCNTTFESPCWNAIDTDHNHIETLCKKCFPPKHGGSLDEERIYRYLKEKMPIEEIVHKHGSRLILGDGRELDIYIPKYKTAIEYCGLYTHNSSNEHHSGKVLPSDYHISKYLLCKEKGIRLITVFDKRKSDNYIEEIYNSMIGNDLTKFEDLKLYLKDGNWYYNLDNTWTSFEFFKFKNMFELVEQHEQVCWFYDDNYQCSFISYNDFKEGYCSDTDDVFKVARKSVYNKWYYDCGYQILKLKPEFVSLVK